MLPHWLLDGRRINDPDERAGQQLLAIAHSRQTRPLCQCVDGGIETYVAKTPGGRFIIKRMPNSGPRHHPDCDYFEPPRALSGRASITTGEDRDGVTVLRLGFPLTRESHPRGTASTSSTRAAGSDRHRQNPSGHQLSLEALLHYLWDEAGFTRWSPRMAGKRNWSLIRYHLTRVAEQTVIGGESLDHLIWIPEPFDRHHRHEIDARRLQAWEQLRSDDPEQRQFGIAILEWSEIKPARYGHAVSVKQMGWPPFMIHDVVLESLTTRFPQLELHDEHPEGHLVTAATFSLSRGGYPVVEDAAFLATDERWLPYATTAGLELLGAAAVAGRRFTTPLRYAMATTHPLPAVVLTDTPDPVAAYIVADHHEAERAQQAAEEAGISVWLWPTEHALPALPAPR